jgi:hypothetical protein
MAAMALWMSAAYAQNAGQSASDAGKACSAAHEYVSLIKVSIIPSVVFSRSMLSIWGRMARHVTAPRLRGRKTAAEAARLFSVHPATISRLLSRARAGASLKDAAKFL